MDGFRVWDPYRIKLAVDYVESVYAVEFAPRPMQDLLMVVRKRKILCRFFGM